MVLVVVEADWVESAGAGSTVVVVVVVEDWVESAGAASLVVVVEVDEESVELPAMTWSEAVAVVVDDEVDDWDESPAAA